MATDPERGYEHQVKQLMIDRLGLDRVADEIPDDASLIDAFGLDSAGIFTTVMALEEHFDIEIDDSELTNDVFSSVANLAALVRSKAA